MQKVCVEMTNLTKKFGKATALDNVSLKLYEGEVFGYIGPNGAGKTTTIRLLLGSLKATSGNATIFGMNVWKDAVEIHKRIAYVPGEMNLWKNMTGGEVLDLFMSLQGNPNKEKREKYIKPFDLDPSKKCGTYSKGNRQKVALVAAFASDADLLIFDEPTSGLDPLMEQVFVDCVAEEKKKGKTILLSSHILSEVERICDRVGILREGKIVETGTLEELRHLTSTTMTIETRLPVEHLETLAGVSDIMREGNKITFHVDSEETEQIITYLSKFGVQKIESTPATLEDLFMRRYNANGR